MSKLLAGIFLFIYEMLMCRYLMKLSHSCGMWLCLRRQRA